MKEVKIIITVNQAGEINVVGPLHDKILCFGLLEVAKQTIANQKIEDLPKIQVPKLDTILPT